MNSNLPQIRKENFFSKLRKWIKKLFIKEEIIIEEPVKDAINEINNSANEIKKSDFINELKVENKDKIIALQRKLKEKQIEIAELTDEELDELIAIYKQQIEYKKDKLRLYKNKIKKLGGN